jgi:hypothetical protein
MEIIEPECLTGLENWNGCGLFGYRSRFFWAARPILVAKRDANLAADSPLNAAVLDRFAAVQHQIKIVRDASLALDQQACAGIRQISNCASGARTELMEGNLGSLQDSMTRRPPVVCGLIVHDAAPCAADISASLTAN